MKIFIPWGLGPSGFVADGIRSDLGINIFSFPKKQTVPIRHALQGKEKTYNNTSPLPPFLKRPCHGEKWPVPMNLPFFAAEAYVPGGGVQNQAETKNRKMPSGWCRCQNLLFQRWTQTDLKRTETDPKWTETEPRNGPKSSSLGWDGRGLGWGGGGCKGKRKSLLKSIGECLKSARSHITNPLSGH